MTALTFVRPMRPETYPAYLEASISGYAHDNVAAGRWAEDGALEQSAAEFHSLLSQGLATPDHFLCEIAEENGGPCIGFVWYGVHAKHGSCTAYIYDLELKKEHRRKGHAYRALQWVETMAAAAGATSIGLNVFVSNPGAQALYRKLGYVPTNTNMRKPLRPED